MINEIKLPHKECKFSKCGVIDNNIKLRTENFELKKEKQDSRDKIRILIEQLESEAEPVNGNEWQSGYNNGLARAVGLLCEILKTNNYYLGGIE